jgi:hypothetical protein
MSCVTLRKILIVYDENLLAPGPNPESVVRSYTPRLKVISYSFQRLNNDFIHTPNFAMQVEWILNSIVKIKFTLPDTVLTL